MDNEGDGVHDLALDGGARTTKLDPDQSQQLDLGVITSSLPELYCTLPGHKSAGMTLDVQIQARADVGYAAEVLARASADLELLAVGSRGYGPLRSVLLGSVSTALVRSAQSPLVVVPRGASS